MRSIFRYPGGKSRRSIQKWILSHKPKDIKDYREPFVGGGGIFFAMPRNIDRRWINDMNAGLVAVYQALIERPESFIARCQAVRPPQPGEPETDHGVRGGKKLNRRLKEEFDRVQNEETDVAYRYFFTNRTVFGGRVNYDIPSRLYFSNPEGWEVVEGDRLERAAAHLKGVQVTQGDFEPLFDQDGTDVWIYADPPYFRDTGLTATSKLYQHSFGEADHARLAEAVKRCKHSVCLSYDDCAEVRKLYPPPFRIVANEWAYCGTTKEEKDVGRELLIFNYDPPRVPQQRQLSEVAGLQDMPQEDWDELEVQEERLARCFWAFVEAGEALTIIRDRRLFRAEFRNFAQYCRQRWRKSLPYATQLIYACEVVSRLKKFAIANFLPETETQARELTRLKDSDNDIDHDCVAEVWSRVVAQAQNNPANVTAKVIRDEVNATLGISPKEARRLSNLDSVLARLPELTPANLLTVRKAVDSLLVQGGTGNEQV